MLNNSISRTLTLVGACFAAILPFFWWGNPSGHDFEFHLYSWMEVLGQWRNGILYPSWAALAHWGYGEARFLFYPPASWTLGAALGAILPWKLVPGAYCWIALTLAAAAMYRLGREWLSTRDALFAAILYASNPYHLLVIYWRSAYAELLAAGLFPLLVLCLLRIFSQESETGVRTTLCLSLVLAAGWLTNVPAAVMIHYSAAGMAVVLAATWGAMEGGRKLLLGSKPWRGLIRVGMAMILGAGLASFYLIPAIYEQKWIDISQVLSPGVRPQDHFLFTILPDADHNRFNYLVSTVALVEAFVLFFAIAFSRRRLVGAMDRTRRLLLSCWGAGCAVLLLPASKLLWEHLPKLRFVQLPFRWLLCMNAALALLITMATRRWTPRLLAFAFLLTSLIAAGYRFQHPWWDKAADFREMVEAMANRTGYEGTDEYVPAGADAYELNRDLPLISNEAGEPVTGKILEWKPTERHFVVHAVDAKNLIVRLFSYPAWEVVANGQPVRIRKTGVTGLMVIPVLVGDTDVHIYFRRTIDRVAGDFVSLFSLIVLIVLWIWTKPWIATR